MSNIYIAGFLDDVPRNQHSHYHGWMKLIEATLNTFPLEPTPHYEALFSEKGKQIPWKGLSGILAFHHGLYYYGEDYALNVFGGMTPENEEKFADRLEELLERKAEIYSLEYPWPKTMFSSLCSRAKGDRLRALCLEAERFRMNEILGTVEPWDRASESSRFDRLVIGDSHSGASWLPGSIVYRNDRETLHGALKRGLRKKIDTRFPAIFSPNVGGKVTKLCVHYGNIDIRHHVCRLGNGYGSETVKIIRTLVDELVRQVDELGFKEVELTAPYPIENESRQISKSVWYEGKPFWGTWAERGAAALEMADQMEKAAGNRPGWSVVRWDHLRNSKRELDFEYMEKPKSIHLSPTVYRGASHIFPRTDSLDSFFS